MITVCVEAGRGARGVAPEADRLHDRCRGVLAACLDIAVDQARWEVGSVRGFLDQDPAVHDRDPADADRLLGRRCVGFARAEIAL